MQSNGEKPVLRWLQSASELPPARSSPVAGTLAELHVSSATEVDDKVVLFFVPTNLWYRNYCPL